MKHFGKAFIVSVVLGAGAMVCAYLQHYLIAAILCVPSFFAVAGEIKKYASMYQFISFRIITILLGICIDKMIGNAAYLYTLSMFTMSFAGVVRLEFFKIFLVGRYYWVEAIALATTYGIYIYAGLQHPADWRGWALPALPMLLMTYIATSIFLGGAKMKQNEQKKYRVALGEKAPNFTLPDHKGMPVGLSSFENKNHVLLIFVRGDWCPTCHMMIRTYEKNRDKFMEKEVVAVGIGPDTTEVNQEMMKRLGWKNIFLSDSTQEVTKKYGIAFMENNPETKYAEGVPLPASFLIDKKGVIRYISRPDKIGEFLNPSLIFPIVENLN
jgi:peroxiredoxin